MKRGPRPAVFALHLGFALVCAVMLALDMVKAEAALTNGQMLALKEISAARAGR